ncbi:signal recognition particle, SRP9/SRP14 subunit [Rhizoctonia solani]|nr:signal recognition particle, SRP9/SRP14 subunit [Rhizoctonia solani]
MVYIASWNEFQEAAEVLYTKSPTRTRYVVKWKPSIGVLVLKITDDETCLKFRTHSSIMLGRFETLNLELMRRMQNRTAPPPSTILETAAATQPDSAVTSSVPAAGAGAGKKKKPKKKK